MARSKIIPLYAQVSGLIEQDITSGRFKPGDRIYSIREICAQFKVADTTAKKALKGLSERGIIRIVTGSGAYVCETGQGPASEPAPKPQGVGFLKVGMHFSAIFVYEIDLLQRELARLGHPMTYTVVESADEVPDALQQLVQSGAGCLVVFPQHSGDFEKEPYMADLRRSGLPLLVLETPSVRDAYVSADSARATSELAEFLYELGHRRICLATTFKRKVEGFERALKRWNDPDVISWAFGESGQGESELHHLAQQIMELDPKPTAVIAGDDHAAAVFINHFLAGGLRIPEDISVATYGDHPQQRQLSPIAVTVMRHPYLEVAQEVAEWTRRQITGVASKRRLRRDMTGSLIVRDSTAAPGDGK